MTISKKNYEKLCTVARALNDVEHEDYDFTEEELYKMICDVIYSIKD